jgi:tripartite-type tricarboxylate transporter receptor subunit TctC
MSRTLRLLPLVLLLAVAAASAQTWPAKPVRFLVGFAPGGSTDIVARLIAQEMGKSMPTLKSSDGSASRGGAGAPFMGMRPPVARRAADKMIRDLAPSVSEAAVE